MTQTLKIGTRASPLAMVQTKQVQQLLQQHQPDLNLEIITIKTSAEWHPSHGEKRLSAHDGGKGLFTKEIEESLLDGRIDIAVHSMKDVETFMPEGLIIGAALEREDPRDALLLRDGLIAKTLDDLPQGSVIGTASVRRGALVRAKRPDIQLTTLRGNVQTRIDKIRSGQVDASFLAMAGLNRLDLSHEADLVMDPHGMCPAAGQGIVGIQCRAEDKHVRSLLNPLNHQDTYLCLLAERACLAFLDGSCHTPIGAYAQFENGIMNMQGCLAALDGSLYFDAAIEGEIATDDQAEALGRSLGEALKSQAPQEILQQVADG